MIANISSEESSHLSAKTAQAAKTRRSSTANNESSLVSGQQQPVRKSQRKRQTNKKFADDEYALDDPVNLDESSERKVSLRSKPNESKSADLPLRVSLEAEKKGELKLRIKRVVTPSLPTQATFSASIACETNDDQANSSDLNNSTSLSVEEKRSRRKRNISDCDALNKTDSQISENENELNISHSTELNESFSSVTTSKSTKTAKPASVAKILAELPLTISPSSSPSHNIACSSLSPSSSNTPMTRAAAAKLKQQISPSPQAAPASSAPLIDVKLLPPPPPLLVPPQNLFNDEENDDEEFSLFKSASSSLNSSTSTSNAFASSSSSLLEINKSPKLNSGPVKTLAQVRTELAEKKRKAGAAVVAEVKSANEEESSETKRPRLDAEQKDSYTSNIEKIVHELKSFGGASSNRDEESRIG
jgi:hypothetical protein